MSNSTLVKPIGAESSRSRKEKTPMADILRQSTFGSAIADFADSQSLSPRQLIKRAGINPSTFRDSAERGFRSIQVNNAKSIIEKLAAIGFEPEPEILLSLFR
jgi:hypothetical protein